MGANGSLAQKQLERVISLPIAKGDARPYNPLAAG
eukprot:gene1628-1659_t